MKIVFLIHNVYGIGGTIRSTLNLSGALAARHDVEIVSVHRPAKAPELPVDPRVKVTPLIDMREDSPRYDGRHELAGRPSELFTDQRVAQGRLVYSALSDARVKRFLARTDADVVIATRPVLNGYLARYGRARQLRVGQEHLTYGAHDEVTRAGQNAAVAELDAFVTVSEGDAADYRRALGELPTRIVCVPNAVPEPAVEPSDLESRIVVAAGRLVSVKRYDRLVHAFARVREVHPDWTLRIYGRGPQRAALRELIDRLGLYDSAFLMGARSPIETEWAKGAVAAVSSDGESFGMTIVEAMHCGVPVVATDCPFGPAEIIEDGADGLLVPLDDPGDAATEAYARALLRLIEDPGLRHRLGRAARLTARAYRPSAIARRYEALFRELLAERYLVRVRAEAARPAPSPLVRARAAARSAARAAAASLRPSPAAPSAASSPPAAPPAAVAGPAAARADGAQGDGAPPPWPRPVAACAVDGKGHIAVRITAEGLPGGDLDLLLRLRGAEPPVEVRVPLPPRTQLRGTRVEAVLERGRDLAEGRWDGYVEHAASGRRRRIAAELVEQRHLLGLVPDTAGAVRARIPYTTTDGFLAVRAWRRAGHAEVVRVRVDGEGTDVAAAVHGAAPLGPGCAVEVRSREGGGRTFEVAAGVEDGERVAFRVPHAPLVARRAGAHDLWDLWLRPARGAEPVRLARILGDVVDRRRTDVVPPVPVAPGLLVKPYFTVDNDLSLSVRDAREPDGPAGGGREEPSAG